MLWCKINIPTLPYFYEHFDDDDDVSNCIAETARTLFQMFQMRNKVEFLFKDFRREYFYTFIFSFKVGEMPLF